MDKTGLSYIGKKVFIGIDVHRRTYAITAICDSEVIKKWSMEASSKKLVSCLQDYFEGGDLYSAYEAGFSGFVLHRRLVSAGITNIVVNASSIEVSSRDLVKTDKRDSLKLATHLSLGRLKGILIPSIEQERARQLSRTRTQLVRRRASVMNQVRMKLHYFELVGVEYRGILRRDYVESVVSSEAEDIRDSVICLCEVWKSLDVEIKRLDTKLRKQAAEDYLEQTYRSLPGIGRVASRILSNELGDLSAFSNERSLYSYVGLTPMEFSSGDKRRKGSITRQGKSILRATLVECAWVALRKDEGLRADFARISIRSGKKRAILAIAKKLISRAKALFREERLYEFRAAA